MKLTVLFIYLPFVQLVSFRMSHIAKNDAWDPSTWSAIFPAPLKLAFGDKGLAQGPRSDSIMAKTGTATCSCHQTFLQLAGAVLYV